MFRGWKIALVVVVAVSSVFACGSESISETAVLVPSSPTATLTATATSIPVPAVQPTEISTTPIVRTDNGTIVIERGMTVPKQSLGVRSSTTYSPQTGKTVTTTIYMIDETLADLPWVSESTTPASTEMSCSSIGTAGSWRGNPLLIGDDITVGEVKLRIEQSSENPETLLLSVANIGGKRVEISEYSFELIDSLWAQSADGPRDYRPSFAETIELGSNDTKTLAIDLDNLTEQSSYTEEVVLMFSDQEQGETAYLYLTEPPYSPHICAVFEIHTDAKDAGTTWATRPSPLGRAVKLDDATTARITYVERGTARYLIDAYDSLGVDGAYPKNDDGDLADGYEFLAFQIEIASNYPLMKGDNADDPIDSIRVSGRIADEYSFEFEEILGTPGGVNLVMLEAPLGDDELNSEGYLRLSFIAVTPLEAHNLHVSYASDPFEIPVFLSLEDDPRPRPTPVPVMQMDDDGRIGLMAQVDELSEERLATLLDALSTNERVSYGRLIDNCAQHMVFPSAETRRRVGAAAETMSNSDLAEALPDYFGNIDDPDVFCNDLFPPSSIPRMVETIFWDGQSSIKARCALSDRKGFAYLSSLFMWATEVGLALWGEDAPVSIDSFDDVFEVCDWIESYEPSSN